MLVIHGGWNEGSLWCWAEQTPIENAGKKSSTGRKKTPALSPYTSTWDALKQALETVGCETISAAPTKREAIAWLPTIGASPLPSTPLIAEIPTTKRKPKIQPWRVTFARLSSTDAIHLLSACMDKERLAPGVVSGLDLRFLATALRFAASLVAQGKFLPGLVNVDDAYYARWLPVLTGEDAERKNALVQAMPATCRALSLSMESEPTVAAETLLMEFVQTFVDHLVRCESNKIERSTTKTKKRPSRPAFQSLHDQWMYALQSSDGLMDAELRDLQGLAEQIAQWRRPIALTADAPFRLCFRVEEPAPVDMTEKPRRTRRKKTEEAWFVRYLLQDVGDPSLLIDAGEAWKNKGNKASLLKRPGFSADEYLLFVLGQACNVCPPVTESLKSPKPSGYETDAAGALTFVTESAVVLQQMGFGVLLPSWWTHSGARRRVSLRAKVNSPEMTGGSGLSLDAMLDFQWEASLGDECLSMEELMELARLKTPLIRRRGEWAHIDPKAIQAAIDFLQGRMTDQGALRDVIQMDLGRVRLPSGLEFGGVEADGWVGDLLGKLRGEARFEELKPPSRFQGELRPYQRRGFSWLSFLSELGLGACLADDMGLGKTVQTLVKIQRDWNENGKKPTLLVCPTSVVGNWQKEAERFTPDMPILIHHGATRKKGKSFEKNASKSAIVITSYALLHRDFESFKSVAWRGVVLDEAQNIKNPKTKQAKSARALPSEYRIALTGTPVENNIGELWSIMEFLNPGFLGSQAEFKETFFIPIQTLRDNEAISRLKRLTSPFILRRLKTDKSIITDLPDKMEMKVYCNLTKEQASLYQAVVNEIDEALESAEGIQRKGLVLAALSKLKQVCNHPAQFLGDHSELAGRSGKLARLVEMLEEIMEMGEKTLIFSQFSAMGEMLQRHLQEQFGQEALFLHGGVAKKKRDGMVEAFQQPDGPKIFILSLKAGGTGLNLTQANHVFHFDRWWNPAVENQATDRAFRIGQTKNVQVHKYLCVGTLEERIDAMIESKKEIAEGVVGAGEGWLTELSTQELKDLFRLEKSAVSE